MDSVALWTNEAYRDEKRERKDLRDNMNIMELSQRSFIRNFRLSKEAFNYVLGSISPDLPAHKRSTAIAPAVKLAATLKFLGQGGYQHQIGQDRFAALAQSTTSKCVWQVVNAIEKTLCPKHIKFKMTALEKREAKSYFYSKFGLPGIIGAVDGTHIQMVRPIKDEHLFFNRKLKHSINAMVICDHKMYIRAVNGAYGGAAHDSHVWALSKERRHLKSNYQAGDKSSWLLGDSGYPLEPWLLTPYRNAAENSLESIYNERFAKARSIIERVFGLLKSRFRCLLASRELHYPPERVVKIFNACSALHNICLEYNIDPPDVLEVSEEGSNSVVSGTASNLEGSQCLRIGQAIRDRIKNSLRT